MFVYIQCIQRVLGNRGVDPSITFNLSEIPRTAEKGVSDTRRTAAPACYLECPFVCDGSTQDARRTKHYGGQQLSIVVLQSCIYPEPSPKRRSKKPRARSCPDQRKRIQRDLYGTCIRPCLQHDIDLKILHG